MIVRSLARLVAATSWIDRAYRTFDRARSRLVLAFASDRFFDSYNDLAYGTTGSYRADSPAFRGELFAWEKAAVEKFFPCAPARVLVGGVGGGREAFGLQDLGYQVVAFDPSARLIGSMLARLESDAQKVAPLALFQSGYLDLPTLTAVPGGERVDLRTEPPFDAAILGWTSISHLRYDRDRVEALRRMADLTHGPILLSYFGRAERMSGGDGVGRWRWLRNARGPDAVFSVQVGYYRLLTASDVEALAAAAGLKVLSIVSEGDWPHAVLGRW